MRHLPRTSALTFALAAASLSMTSCAGMDNKDFANILESGSQIFTQGGADAALSNSDIVTGFKEALAKGVESAITELGRTDGYLGNALVRIEPPEQLDKIAKGLKTIGQGHVVDNFRTSLNRAAERAVPEVSSIFGDTIRAINFADVRSLLSGGDQAVTQFFQAKTTAALTAKIRPIVEQATTTVGVTQQYKQMIDSAGFLASFLDTDSTDLDGYVTREALDGLFTKIGEQEQQIRNNPAARSSDILKKVFGQQ